jgi:hypothetical protein
MTAIQRLHLHHTDPFAKLAGLPGDQLAHAGCNVREGAERGASITNGMTVTTQVTEVPERHSRIW